MNVSNTITDKLWSVHIASDMCGVLSQKADFLHFPATKHSLEGVTLHLTWRPGLQTTIYGRCCVPGPRDMRQWHRGSYFSLSSLPWLQARHRWNVELTSHQNTSCCHNSWELTPSYPCLATLSPSVKGLTRDTELWSLWIWQQVDHPEDNLKLCSLMHSLIMCENTE